MATYNTPGVYLQEISTLPASVAQVATAIPAFIGYTEKAVKKGKPVTLVPTRISSMLEYEEIFGGPNSSIEVTLDANNEITAVDADTGTLVHKMYYGLQMYFANGGGSCYIVSVAPYTDLSIDPLELTAGLDKLEAEDEPTLIVFPDAISIEDTSTNPDPDNGPSRFGGVYQAALAQCAKLQDRFTIMDVYRGTSNDSTVISDFRGAIGTNNLKYGAAYFPMLSTLLSYRYADTGVSFIQDSPGIFGGKTLSDIYAIIAANAPANQADIATYKAVLNDLFLSNVRDSAAQQIGSIILGPSVAIAGIYAAVDAARGVWKAPANVSVSSVINPLVKISDEDQGLLNVDAETGKSINVIRTFTGKGTLVWGARTLAGNDNEWRYINVRRLFITVEESVKKACAFSVFESNNANTWTKVKAMTENYLSGLWRDGALAGATPEEAFFVNVGLGITMTADDILNGKLNIEIGLAAVRPAEFIILKFSHKIQTS